MAIKIERSTGLYTGYMSYFCGNGYEGSTDVSGANEFNRKERQ